MNEQLASQAVQALLHAKKPKTLCEIGRSLIEARSLVGDAQPHGPRDFIELHQRSRRTAVLLHVADRFLSNAEKAQCGILRWSLAADRP